MTHTIRIDRAQFDQIYDEITDRDLRRVADELIIYGNHTTYRHVTLRSNDGILTIEAADMSSVGRVEKHEEPE